MKKIELKARKFLREIFKGVSFTAMAFVFQACYGPLPDERQYDDVILSGVVVSNSTHMPIEGVKVTVAEGLIYGYTDKNGGYNLYVSRLGLDKDGLNIHFQDVDGTENGHFADTILTVNCKSNDEVISFVELREIPNE